MTAMTPKLKITKKLRVVVTLIKPLHGGSILEGRDTYSAAVGDNNGSI